MERMFEKLRDVEKWPGMKAFGRYLIYSPRLKEGLIRLAPWKKVSAMTGWKAESINCGLNRLSELAAAGEIPIPVYTRAEYRHERLKKDVCLIHFRAVGREKDKPFIILLAGGGYVSVCSLAEAFPVAAKMNNLGYDAFVLTYRVGTRNLMPKPLDDLAAAIQYIKSNEQALSVNAEKYIVCGFSAGGNLAALWGTEQFGYRHYHLNKPKALFLLYPYITASLLQKGNPVTDEMMKICYDKKKPEKAAEKYEILSQVDRDYPSAFLCCCRDDDMVDYHNSVLLCDKLRENNISAELMMGDRGGHGFGDGFGTDVFGWIERAAAFEEKL